MLLYARLLLWYWVEVAPQREADLNAHYDEMYEDHILMENGYWHS